MIPREQIFGNPAAFHSLAEKLNIPVGAELPMVPAVSEASDRGVPFVLSSTANDGNAGAQWKSEIAALAASLWDNANVK